MHSEKHGLLWLFECHYGITLLTISYQCIICLLTDPTLTVENVIGVLKKMGGNWFGSSLCLANHIFVPKSKQQEILERFKSKNEQHRAFADYVLKYIPGISWAILAGALHYLEEKEALTESVKFVRKEQGK